MIIAIYDMDRTITRRGTFVPWLRFWIRTQAPWRVVLLPLLFLAGVAYGLSLLDRGGLKAMAHRIVMGRSVHRQRVQAAAAAFAAAIVPDEVFPGARASIAADRAAGHRLVIATASNAYYADAIAARLGIDDVIATQSTWASDRLLPQLGSENCYGVAKRRLVNAWLDRHALSSAPLLFYSDHLSDLPTFELAVASGGAVIAANPSPALRAEAARRGWQIVDWGVPAGSVFERA